MAISHSSEMTKTTYLQIQLHRLPAADHLRDDLRRLRQRQLQHLVIRDLIHKVDRVQEVGQDELLQRLEFWRLRGGFAERVKGQLGHA